jgi:hypothetical protein
VKIPLFVMTGTLKTTARSVKPPPPSGGVPFDHVTRSIPAFLITFDGGDHMVFSRPKARAGERPATDAA